MTKLNHYIANYQIAAGGEEEDRHVQVCLCRYISPLLILTIAVGSPAVAGVDDERVPAHL